MISFRNDMVRYSLFSVALFTLSIISICGYSNSIDCRGCRGIDSYDIVEHLFFYDKDCAVLMTYEYNNYSASSRRNDIFNQSIYVHQGTIKLYSSDDGGRTWHKQVIYDKDNYYWDCVEMKDCLMLIFLDQVDGLCLISRYDYRDKKVTTIPVGNYYPQSVWLLESGEIQLLAYDVDNENNTVLLTIAQYLGNSPYYQIVPSDYQLAVPFDESRYIHFEKKGSLDGKVIFTTNNYVDEDHRSRIYSWDCYDGTVDTLYVASKSNRWISLPLIRDDIIAGIEQDWRVFWLHKNNIIYSFDKGKTWKKKSFSTMQNVTISYYDHYLYIMKNTNRIFRIYRIDVRKDCNT